MNEPTHPGLSVVVVECVDQALVNAVARAINKASLRGGVTLFDEARAAIAAIREHETCSRCGSQLAPPTLCSECANDKTPPVVTERRAHVDWLGRTW